MFKELVLWIHHIAHDFCINRTLEHVPRHGCRMAVKNSRIANFIFFISIVTPLYFCLLKDVIQMIMGPKKKKKRN
ncbi:uncharacterized protein [Drosophila bipectinata]|uniref:uncharacterized protein n=1 Tax=Drosophila bipectinata TaxID=42026 RepID=UPI001C8A7276|nr:uncharacterized protein LOC108134201 [Drosophila bipectinata]